MAYSNFALEYQKQAVNGASQIGLVVMLYDGAIRFMEGGKQAMLAGNLYEQNNQLIRAQKIVTHLMGTLNMEAGGEVASNLFALYSFVTDQLVKANIHDQPENIDFAIKTFVELRESWQQLDVITKAQKQEEKLLAA